MIDDKKIEDVTEKIFKDKFINCGEMIDEGDIKEAIAFGIKLGINEFLEDLWHPASEKPNIKQGECCVTCLIKFKNGSTELCVYFRNPEGWVCDDMSPKDFKRNFKGWLYIEDLFPKTQKGGNHD